MGCARRRLQVWRVACHLALPMCLALVAGQAVGQGGPVPGDIDLQLSHERSSGHYGDLAPTRIDQTTLTVRYHGRGWSSELQLPWLQVRSDAASGGLPDAAGSGANHERGAGDVWWRSSLTLREFDGAGPGLDLTVKLKAANGSASRGLGTGGRDLAVQLDVVQTIGPATVFGHLGWRHTGDPAGYRPYRNPWYGELGAQHRLESGLDLGAYLTVREPMGRLGPLGEGTAFVAWRQGRQRWQIHLTQGWQTASPQGALGLTWRQRY